MGYGLRGLSREGKGGSQWLHPPSMAQAISKVRGPRLSFYTVSWETTGPPSPGLEASSSPLWWLHALQPCII